MKRVLLVFAPVAPVLVAPATAFALAVGSDGSFTLVSPQQDDENDDDHHEGIDEDHGKIEVEGTITDLTADSVIVQSHETSRVACAIPVGPDPTAMAATTETAAASA